MKSNLEIKKATIDDVQILALLGMVTYKESHEIYIKDRSDLVDYCNQEYSIENLKRKINDADTIYWIAFLNDLPVGFLELKLNTKTPLLPNIICCKLQKIYVLRDFTSMNIGGELQNLCIRQAKSLQFDEVWLTTYYKNLKAINFYNRNGFRQIGEDVFKVMGTSYKQVVFAIKL